LPTLNEAIAEAVERVIAEHRQEVDRWLADEPGAWGFLAGQCIIRCREALGRRLSEAERRAVWQALWDALVELRSA
jgi:Asp-tRNA(Asn)/Glu-tRNA(Gln) amidotransferase B subunit